MDAVLPGAVSESEPSQRHIGRSDSPGVTNTDIATHLQQSASLRARSGPGTRDTDEQSLGVLVPQKQMDHGKRPPVEELECQMHCGYLGNPHWHNLCSRCFYFHALLPALAYETPNPLAEVPRARLHDKSRSVFSSRKTRTSRISLVAKKASAVWSQLGGHHDDPPSPTSPTSPKSWDGKPAPTSPTSPTAPTFLTLLKGQNLANGSASAQATPVCLACITAVQIGIFIFTLIVNGGVEPVSVNPMIGPSVKTLQQCGGLYIWTTSDPWRLMSCVFLHAGALHLIPNLLLQWWVGRGLEALWGARHFAEIYVTAGLAGSLLSAALSDRGMLTVGASGALHGLFAARLVGGPGASTSAGDAVAERYTWRLTAMGLAISLALGAFRLSEALPRVDAWSHVGGTFAGFTTAASILWRRDDSPRGSCCCMVRLLMGAFGLAFASLCLYGLSCSGCYEPPGALQDTLKDTLVR